MKTKNNVTLNLVTHLTHLVNGQIGQNVLLVEEDVEDVHGHALVLEIVTVWEFWKMKTLVQIYQNVKVQQS